MRNISSDHDGSPHKRVDGANRDELLDNDGIHFIGYGRV
jgi:hypothetical protein